jgi:hypothetical protein
MRGSTSQGPGAHHVCISHPITPPRLFRLRRRTRANKYHPLLAADAIFDSLPLIPSSTMSFQALRAAARAAPRALPKAPARAAVRRYATGNTGKSSNTPLFAGLAALGAAGAGYWVLTSSSDQAKEAGTLAKSGAQAVKAAAHYTPTKEDYQKVGVWFIC